MHGKTQFSLPRAARIAWRSGCAGSISGLRRICGWMQTRGCDAVSRSSLTLAGSQDTRLLSIDCMQIRFLQMSRTTVSSRSSRSKQVKAKLGCLRPRQRQRFRDLSTDQGSIFKQEISAASNSSSRVVIRDHYSATDRMRAQLASDSRASVMVTGREGSQVAAEESSKFVSKR